MTLNHNRIRQTLHAITILAFSVSVLFQLKNLYVYGGKPPKTIDDDNDDNELERVPLEYGGNETTDETLEEVEMERS